MPRPGAVAITLTVLLMGTAGCGDDPPPDGFRSLASGDTYGEWELLAEYEDGEWTGCLRMSYDDDGPMCADPDSGLVTFQDWTGALYGAVPEGVGLERDGEPVSLIHDRFFVMIEGAEPDDLSLVEP